MLDQKDPQEMQVPLVEEAQDQLEPQDPLEPQVPMDKPANPDLQDNLEVVEAAEKRVSAPFIALLMVAFSSLKMGNWSNAYKMGPRV